MNERLLDRPVLPTRSAGDIMAVLMDAFAGRRLPSDSYLARYEGYTEEQKSYYANITQGINKLDAAGKRQALVRIDGDTSSLAEYLRAVIIQPSEHAMAHALNSALLGCPIACVNVVRQLLALNTGILRSRSQALDALAESDLMDIVCMVGLCARITGKISGSLFDDILSDRRLYQLVTEGEWFLLAPSVQHHSRIRLGSLDITASSVGTREIRTIARLIVAVDDFLKDGTEVPPDVVTAAAELDIEVNWFNRARLAFSFNGLSCLVKPEELAITAKSIREQDGNPYAYENHWPAATLWASELSREELQKGAAEIRTNDLGRQAAQEGYLAALSILGICKSSIEMLAADVNTPTTPFSLTVLHRLVVKAEAEDANDLCKAIKYLISHRGANVNAQDDAGFTAATYLFTQSGAAYSDKAEEILQDLIDAGADLEVPFGSPNPVRRTKTIANDMRRHLPEGMVSILEKAIGRPVARSRSGLDSASAEIAVTLAI